jgi:hypothetical protein
MPANLVTAAGFIHYVRHPFLIDVIVSDTFRFLLSCHQKMKRCQSNNLLYNSESGALFEKLIVAQLRIKLSKFYGIRTFITAFQDPITALSTEPLEATPFLHSVVL